MKRSAVRTVLLVGTFASACVPEGRTPSHLRPGEFATIPDAATAADRGSPAVDSRAADAGGGLAGRDSDVGPGAEAGNPPRLDGAASVPDTSKDSVPPVATADGGSSGTAPGFPPKGQCIAGTMLRGALPAPAPDLPASKLDFGPWKLTLPVKDDLNCNRSDPSSAKEIKQPLLNQFKDERFFFLAPDGAVVFRAGAAGAATTTNSKYPRSELREARPYDAVLGPREASWDTDDGKTHTMTLSQSITELPSSPRKVVAAQIHDAADDLIMVALTDQRLDVEWMDGKLFGTLDAAYKLGTRFTLKIEAARGRIRVFYGDMTTPKIDKVVAAKGCYFKAGVYSQSVGSGNGEVRIYELNVAHQ